jgi:thioredoxin reductase (NADPH)
VVFEMQKQAAKYGAVFHDDSVVSVELARGEVCTDGGDGSALHVLRTNSSIIRTHAVIVATGANSRWLGVEGEERFRGGGISSCATCDGYLYRDRPVALIGGGDTAMEEALHLAQTSSKVTIVHRGASFGKASTVLRERVLAHDKITVLYNTTVLRFEGRAETEAERAKDPHSAAHGADPQEPEQPMLTHVVLRTAGQKEVHSLAVDGAFIAIGHDPNTAVFKGQLEMDAVGYLVTRKGSTHTTVRGVFAAGDVADPVYRQAITSAGTGCMSALDAERWLHEHGIEDKRKRADDAFMQELLSEIRRKQPQEEQ